MDVLPHLEPVDLVLTDPPYGLGISSNPVRQLHEKQDWDSAPVDAELLSVCMDAGREQIVWGGNYFGLPAHQCFLVWNKHQPQDFSLAMCEQAWTSLKMPAKLFSRSVRYLKEHPTEKPIELMRWCIEMCSGEPSTILDPFMGSGTTLRAAKDLGRKAIGIEIEEKYCEIAAKRLAQEVLPFDAVG